MEVIPDLAKKRDSISLKNGSITQADSLRKIENTLIKMIRHHLEDSKHFFHLEKMYKVINLQRYGKMSIKGYKFSNHKNFDYSRAVTKL